LPDDILLLNIYNDYHHLQPSGVTLKDKQKYILITLALIFVSIVIFQILKLGEKNNQLIKQIETLNKLTQTSEIAEKDKQRYIANLDKVKNIIINTYNPETFTDKVQLTMEFVHNNSLHLLDEEYYNYAFNTPIVINKLLLAQGGNINEKPHLSCGSRSYAMRDILIRFGINSRMVQVYSDDFNIVEAHRFLEVYNQGRNQWEVWDPDYNITYIDKHSTMPVDITTMVLEGLENIVPKQGEITGWNETSSNVLRKKNYLSMVRFESMENSIIMINSKRFNLEKKYSDGLTFQDWANKNYVNPRFIVL